MQPHSVAFFAVAFVALSGITRVLAISSGDGEHPVVKVTKLLEGLAAKAEAEGKEEALAYEKFEYWCKNSFKELSTSIEAEKEAIASLEDKIASNEQQEKQLTKEIGALQVQLTELDEASAKAKADREAGKALYDDTSKDLSETIAAMTEAIEALTSAKGGFVQVLAQPRVRTALALAQAAAPVNSERSRTLAALVQARPASLLRARQPDFKTRPDFEAAGDRASHVQKYKFKSGDIIETLKTLKKEFEDQELAATKAETNAINAYDLAKQSRDKVKSTSEASLAETKSVLADVKADLATFRGELDSVRSDKEADEASYAETEKACTVKSQEWEERSSVRTAEIEAIAAAVKILADATGVRTEAPENPVVLAQKPGPLRGTAALLQMSDPRERALDLLRKAARRSHSHGLERLAQELSTHLDDPFQAVTNMIQKMIFHLMDEQKQEDEHKAWCDQEISLNNASKVDKEDKVADLARKIDSGDALVVKLTSDVAEAEAKIAEITSFMQEATEIREIGKKENALALADAQTAQTAITDAIGVLEAFYKESGMVAKQPYEDFLQQKQPVELSGTPDTWGSSYTGVADPAAQPDGIISVLKKVQSEFATMEADTRAQEATDQAQYEETIKDEKIEKAGREQEVETKKAEKARHVEILASRAEEKKQISDELETVNLYLKDLVPACVAGDSTYEERKEARKDETEALNEALAIFADAYKEEASEPTAPPESDGLLLAARSRRSGVHRHW